MPHSFDHRLDAMTNPLWPQWLRGPKTTPAPRPLPTLKELVDAQKTKLVPRTLMSIFSGRTPSGASTAPTPVAPYVAPSGPIGAPFHLAPLADPELKGKIPVIPREAKLVQPRYASPALLALPPKPERKPEPPLAALPPEPTDLANALGTSESGNRYEVVNNLGYMGKYQFGDARLTDYKNATKEKFNRKTFLENPELQEKVFNWHANDIKKYIKKNELDAFIGQEINGVPVTLNGLISVAHLGGKTGMKKFVKSKGDYNPTDANGTSLTAYLDKFKGVNN